MLFKPASNAWASSCACFDRCLYSRPMQRLDRGSPREPSIVHGQSRWVSPTMRTTKASVQLQDDASEGQSLGVQKTLKLGQPNSSLSCWSARPPTRGEDLCPTGQNFPSSWSDSSRGRFGEVTARLPIPQSRFFSLSLPFPGQRPSLLYSGIDPFGNVPLASGHSEVGHRTEVEGLALFPTVVCQLGDLSTSGLQLDMQERRLGIVSPWRLGS